MSSQASSAEQTPARGATALFSDEGFALGAYMRDHSGNRDLAERFMKEGDSWRKLMRPDLLRISDAHAGLRKYQLFVRGTARNGLPIIWCDSFGEVHHLLQGMELSEVKSTLRAFNYLIETTLSRTAPAVNVAVNCSRLDFSRIDELLFRILTYINELAYPDTMSGYWLFGFPRVVGVLWHTIRPLVPNFWRERVHLLSGDAGASLRQLADASQLPARYGGTRSDEEYSVQSYIDERTAAESNLPAVTLPDVGIPPFTPLFIELDWDARDIPDAVMSGNLKKKGGIVMGWKRLFVVLRPGWVLYFKGDTERKPSGAIDLRAVRQVRVGAASDAFKSSTRARGFVVSVPVRDYLFYAKNASSRDEWVSRIHGSVTASQGEK